jgi:cell division protein FtsW
LQTAQAGQRIFSRLKGLLRGRSLSLSGVDSVLLLLTAGLVIFGLIMVYSSSFIFAQERTGDGFAFIKKQIFFAILGSLLLAVAAQIPHHNWKKWAYPLLISALVSLLVVLIPGIGAKTGGAQRWIRLFGFQFQPAEWTKFACMVFVARQLTVKKADIHRFIPAVLSVFVLLLPVFGLLLLQPDFGSTAVIVMVAFLLMFLGGVPMRFLGTVLASGLALGTFLALGSAYRRARIMTFLDPWSDPSGKGFQILQSFVGLHSGGISGVGLGNGKEKLFFLPEAHNDFIFSVIGEELGFIGLAALVAGFVILVYRGLLVSWQVWDRRNDFFGMLLGSGITLLLGLQAFLNMAVVLGLIPTKGLALPFISYGGSALVIDLFAMGVLLSISRSTGSKIT